jgi:hypothetical protein
VADGIEDALEFRRDRFRHASGFGRPDDTLEPEVPTQAREGIGKGRRWPGTPGGPAGRESKALGILPHIRVLAGAAKPCSSGPAMSA